MAFGGNEPAQLIKHWSRLLDDSRDLAGHYTSEESIWDELQSVRDMAETHIASAVVLRHRARVNEEILDGNAVQLATDDYAESSKAHRPVR